MLTIDRRADSSREDEIEPEKVLESVPRHGVRYFLPLVEVLSVSIMNFHGNLYGTIIVTDGWGTEYLYNRKREEFQSIGPDNNVLLTGPSRAITACDNFNIYVDLWDADSDLPLLSGGLMEWTVFIRHINVYDKPTYEDVEGKDGYGSVRVNYMVLRDAVKATVKVTLIMGDGEDLAHVYGTITACNSNISDEGVLFQKAWNEHIDVRSGQLIPLSRSIVAVPFKSSLIVRADLQDYDASNVISKDTAQFPAKLSGTFEKCIYGQRCGIRVNVTYEKHV